MNWFRNFLLLGILFALIWLVWCAFVLPENTPPLIVAVLSTMSFILAANVRRRA